MVPAALYATWAIRKSPSITSVGTARWSESPLSKNPPAVSTDLKVVDVAWGGDVVVVVSGGEEFLAGLPASAGAANRGTAAISVATATNSARRRPDDLVRILMPDLPPVASPLHELSAEGGDRPSIIRMASALSRHLQADGEAVSADRCRRICRVSVLLPARWAMEARIQRVGGTSAAIGAQRLHGRDFDYIDRPVEVQDAGGRQIGFGAAPG